MLSKATLLRVHLRREPLLLGALAMLCCGEMSNLGELSVTGVIFILLALSLTLLATRASDEAAGRRTWAATVLVCALTLLLAARLNGVAEMCIAAGLIALTTGLIYVPRGVRMPVMVAAAVTLVALTVVPWRFGTADIDVFKSVQQAGDALLHWQNPYSSTFITADQVDSQTFVMQRVHFQYLPGVALLAVPGRLLGDVRLIAVLATLALIAATLHLAAQSPERRTRLPRMFALCCAIPVSVLMVLNAWVDVYAVAGFAGWLALRRTHPRWAMVPLALCFTIKPTILIAVVPVFLWSRRARREVMTAGAGAALLILPFMLITGPAALFHDVLGVQAQLGFRYDGLTLSALGYALTGLLLPSWLSLVLGLPFAWLALRRRPRDLSDVLTSGAILSTAAFLLAKWAFFNYYFIPIWLLALALAARGVQFDAAADTALPALPRWLRTRLPLTVPRLRRLPDRGAEPALD